MGASGGIEDDAEYLEVLANTLEAEAKKHFPGDKRAGLLGGAAAVRTAATMLRARHKWRDSELTPTVCVDMPEAAYPLDDPTDVD